MTHYTYLLIDFLSVIVCFIFSFDKRIRFNVYFGPFLKAAALVAAPFIAWDIWFTAKGIWWFNGDYTIGLNLLGLPVEEWLFFFCIPFSCVFTFFCLDRFTRINPGGRVNAAVSWLAILVCFPVAIIYHDRWYPFVTALTTGIAVLYLHFVARAAWIGKASLAYIILMPGFFLVNGLLTGTALASPVVNYNPAQILNIRLLTIPVEDFVYGYALFVLNIHFFQLFSKKNNS